MAALVQAKLFEESLNNEIVSALETKSPSKLISYEEKEEVPELYLILFQNIINKSDISGKEVISSPRYDHRQEKRMADQDEDLKTAAGTNVLRPLFVYRQQLAYRQRLRKTNRRGFQF